MHIIMVTPEFAPAAKVGGLADVVTGLAKAMLNKGHTVEVLLPMYHSMRYDQVEGLECVYEELWVQHQSQCEPEQVYSGRIEGVPCCFFPCGNRFHRDAIYGYDDDMYRFVHFNRAVMEFLAKTERAPQILHCHDWQTGLVPVLLYSQYTETSLAATRAVFTIHNIEHQGQCWYGEDLLGAIGLDCAEFFTFDRLRDNLKHNMVNLMKGGIVYSNFVTTVSPTYCNEIRSPAGGKGLEATLNAHQAKLGGVLNGVDYEYWNPATDPHLSLPYSADDIMRKFANKDTLREKTGLPNEYRPILACISRLVPQKGLDLIIHGLYHTLERGGQFVLLGASPDPAIRDRFWALRHELEENPNACIELGHNEELAHLIYAGADMILVPSLFEPCGLTQLIGLRYGCVPLVRHTGGLADTVFDVEHSGKGFAAGNGYVFQDPDRGGVESVIDRATECWFYQGQNFLNLARNGMRCDYSWQRSSRDYENIYNYILGE